MAAFRLARVLRLRGQVRRLRQLEADALAADAAELAARGRALADERDRRADDEARVAAGLLGVDELQIGRAYDDALAEAERRCRAEAERVVTALAAKRVELQEERREERKFERLAAVHREREAEHEAQATSVLLDELAILRHGRGRPGSDHGDR